MPTTAEARALQLALRGQVRCEPLALDSVRLVAGADVSYRRWQDTLHVGVVVLSWPALAVVERVGLATRSPFPYVPGLLSFRELPPLLEVWARLSVQPDVLLCDGHGYAHPRRFGLACHVGVTLQLPTIGCAKSRYIGQHLEPGHARGESVALTDGDETIGRVLRTRDGVKPVYVSVGHRVDLDSATALVLACSRTRLPEPTRQAHGFVNELRRGDELRPAAAP